MVKLVGEADISTQITVESALSQALAMNHDNHDNPMLDVSAHIFCDSACVSVVLDANREGRLVLAGGSGLVSPVFHLLDPDQNIPRHG